LQTSHQTLQSAPESSDLAWDKLFPANEPVNTSSTHIWSLWSRRHSREDIQGKEPYPWLALNLGKGLFSERSIIVIDEPTFGDLKTDVLKQALKAYWRFANVDTSTFTPEPTLGWMIERIRGADYDSILGVLSQITNRVNALDTLDTLQRAFSFSIAATDDPLLSAKFQDFQLSLIAIRKEMLRPTANERGFDTRLADLRAKLQATRDVYDSLRELGLNRDEIFKKFRANRLSDGRVQYTWNESG
jgi:hypothetical protein